MLLGVHAWRQLRYWFGKELYVPGIGFLVTFNLAKYSKTKSEGLIGGWKIYVYLKTYKFAKQLSKEYVALHEGKKKVLPSGLRSTDTQFFLSDSQRHQPLSDHYAIISPESPRIAFLVSKGIPSHLYHLSHMNIPHK